MKLPRLLVAPLLALLGACAVRSTLSVHTRPLSDAIGVLTVACDVSEERVAVEVDAQGREVSGVWIERSDGALVEPEEREPQARAVFPRSALGAPPWSVRVLVAEHPPVSVPLWSVRREPVSDCQAVFGYQRETWVHADSTARVLYSRTDPSGGRVEVDQGTYEGRVSPAINRMCTELPATTSRWLRRCPALIHTIARLFEEGVEYAGSVDRGNQHPHARGFRFWSRPQRRIYTPAHQAPPRAVEDPIDTVAWFLLEALNAASAAEFAAVWEDVGSGRSSEAEYLRAEAGLKARNLIRTVQLVRENAACLDLDAWLPDYGLVFQEYAGWVDAAHGDPVELARTILDNPATYTDNPAERDLSYRERLRALYRKRSPRTPS